MRSVGKEVPDPRLITNTALDVWGEAVSEHVNKVKRIKDISS